VEVLDHVGHRVFEPVTGRLPGIALVGRLLYAAQLADRPGGTGQQEIGAGRWNDDAAGVVREELRPGAPAIAGAGYAAERRRVFSALFVLQWRPSECNKEEI